MANLPAIPERLRDEFDKEFPGFWAWWQAMKTYMATTLATDGDFTLAIKGKGVVMTNAAGTVTKRVRLNNAGNGLIYEDV